MAFGRSKADQKAYGEVIAIPDGRSIQPVRLLNAWMLRAGITDSTVFRRLKVGVVISLPMSDRVVARVVQAPAAAAVYDPALFAGHSLRVEFITSGARSASSVFKLKEVSRHRSTDVLAGYVRDAGLFEGHAGDRSL